MVHGLATYGPSWIKNIQGLAPRYRCIAIDLPGHGLSDPLPSTYTMKAMAECLLDFIGRMRLTNVMLMGHSMGAQIAITALLNVPAAASKLILCAPAGFEKFSSTEAFLYKNGLQYASFFGDDKHHLQHLMRQSFSHFPRDADHMLKDLLWLQQHAQHQAYRKMISGCISAMLDQPVYDRLPQIGQKVLILFGDQDALIPNRLIHNLSTEKLAKHVQKRMQNAILYLIHRAGHFVQWEKSEVVNKLIVEFMSAA